MEHNTSPEETPSRIYFLKTFITVLIILIGVSLLFFNPIYTFIKEFRSKQFFKEAQNYLNTNHPDNALSKALLANQLNPKDLQINRFLAEIISPSYPIEALPYWQAVIQSDQKTEKDIHCFIHYCINTHHLELAIPYLQNIIDKDKLSLDEHIIRIRYWQSLNNLDLALDSAQKAYIEYPNAHNIQLALAQLFLYTHQPSNKAIAQNLLLELTQSQESGTRINAYILLLKNFVIDSQLKQTILNDSVFQNEYKKDEYTQANIDILLEPSQKEKIIEETIKKHKEDKNILPLIRFLNQQNAFSKTIECIGSPPPINNKNLIVPYLDALASLNQWSAVSDIVFREDLPLDPFIIQLFRTRVGIQLNDNLLKNSQWKATLTLAKQDKQKLLFLAEYFEKIKEWPFALEAYLELINDSNFSLSASKHIISIATHLEQTSILLNVFKKLSLQFPNDLEPKLGLIYTELLLNKNIEINTVQAQILFKNHPENIYICHLIALGYLLNNQASQALTLYQNHLISLTYAPSAWKAIYACVLAANNQEKNAKKILQTIRIEELKLEEKELIRRFLKTD